MANIKERLAQTQAKSEEIKTKISSTVGDAQAAVELTKEVLDDRIAELKGNINANAENARLAAEKGKSKFNSALLKAQMSIEAARDNIAEKKEARDKEAQERRIIDLLDYADNCQELALALAAESNLAILEAAAEAAEYAEKYGDD